MLLAELRPGEKKVSKISKRTTTPYNQVLETARCKHTFLLVKGNISKTPFRPFWALFEDVTTPDKMLIFAKIQI